MKKLNKIVLAIGTASTVIAPVVAIVSCSSTHKKSKIDTSLDNGGKGSETNIGTKEAKTGTGAEPSTTSKPETDIVTKEAKTGTGAEPSTTSKPETDIVTKKAETGTGAGPSTTSKPKSIYEELTSGDFNLNELLNKLPTILDNKNIDANSIISFTKKLEDSGIIPDSIKEKIQPLLPDTSTSATALEKLFKNGALKGIYTEVMNIMKTGVQGQLDSEHVVASTARYTKIFKEFQEAFPAIKDINSNKAMAAVADVLQHGVGLSDESLDSIIDIVKAMLPQETLDSIHFDQIAFIVKSLKDKSVSALTVPELKKIFAAIGEFVPTIKKIDQDALASIVNHLTNDGYTNFDDFKADLMKVLPDSIKNFKQDLSTLGTMTFSEILKDIETRGTIKLDTGSDITKALNDIVMHGLKDESVNKLLSAVKNWRFLLADVWPIVKNFLPKTIGSLVQKAIDNRGDISGLANHLVHNPVLNIDGSEVDTILELVNKFLGKSMPTDIGTPLVSLLNNAMLSSLSSVDDGIKAITELVKTLAKFEMPDSIMDIVNKIVPVLLIGNDGVAAQSTNAEREFSDMDSKVVEVKLSVGATMPSKYDDKTYSDLKTKYDLDEQKVKVGNPFEIDKALVDAKAVVAKIIKYNDAITTANADWVSLQKARTDFTAKYQTAPSVSAMERITASDTKHLDNAYDAVKEALEKLYKTDISKLDLKSIEDINKKISLYEPLIDEINAEITNINAGDTSGVDALIKRVQTAGIKITGLVWIPVSINDIKKAVDEVSSQAEKGKLIAAWLDENKAILFGDPSDYHDSLIFKLNYGEKSYSDAIKMWASWNAQKFVDGYISSTYYYGKLPKTDDRLQNAYKVFKEIFVELGFNIK